MNHEYSWARFRCGDVFNEQHSDFSRLGGVMLVRCSRSVRIALQVQSEFPQIFHSTEHVKLLRKVILAADAVFDCGANNGRKLQSVVLIVNITYVTLQRPFGVSVEESVVSQARDFEKAWVLLIRLLSVLYTP